MFFVSPDKLRVAEVENSSVELGQPFPQKVTFITAFLLGEKIVLPGKSNQETENIKLLLKRLTDLCCITMSIVYHSILSLQIFKHKCFSSLSFGGLENLRFSRLSSQLYEQTEIIVFLPHWGFKLMSSRSGVGGGGGRET